MFQRRTGSTAPLLLLTATIVPPPGAAQLARTDPALRLRDYMEALTFYLDLLAKGELSGIVFGDNSASDLGKLHELAKSRGLADQVELLSLSALDYPVEYGRGYGEFRLIDLMMERSQLVASLPADGVVWKVTGRYTLRNLVKLMASRPRNVDLYCHCRNLPQRWAELYALGFTKRGYNAILQGRYGVFNESAAGHSAEVSFRDLIEREHDGVRILPRFRVVPVLEGYRGLDNRRYQDSRAKYFVRRASNVLLPWLWI